MTEKDMEIQSLRRELKALKDENKLLKEKLLRYESDSLLAVDMKKAAETIERAMCLVNLPEDTISEIRINEWIRRFMNPFGEKW